MARSMAVGFRKGSASRGLACMVRGARGDAEVVEAAPADDGDGDGYSMSWAKCNGR
jgi:hypothetical protein